MSFLLVRFWLASKSPFNIDSLLISFHPGALSIFRIPSMNRLGKIEEIGSRAREILDVALLVWDNSSELIVFPSEKTIRYGIYSSVILVVK
jgi:hypothetical protein